MTPLRTLRTTLLHPPTFHFHPNITTRHQTRTFLTNPLSLLSTLTSTSSTQTPQTLTATRTLPHPSAPIYSIIADIPSYPTFLPYLTHSAVTSWSAPDDTFHRRWPREATITAGYSGVQEAFTSRVFCVPGRIVESVAGESTDTSLAREEIEHYYRGDPAQQQSARTTPPSPTSIGTGTTTSSSVGSPLLTHLRSKWTLDPLSQNSTRVTLAVEFAFHNPLYAALSSQVAPKVAEYMVRAFERRVEEVLDADPGLRRKELGELGGVGQRSKAKGDGY